MEGEKKGLMANSHTFAFLFFPLFAGFLQVAGGQQPSSRIRGRAEEGAAVEAIVQQRGDKQTNPLKAVLRKDTPRNKIKQIQLNSLDNS